MQTERRGQQVEQKVVGIPIKPDPVVVGEYARLAGLGSFCWRARTPREGEGGGEATVPRKGLVGCVSRSDRDAAGRAGPRVKVLGR